MLSRTPAFRPIPRRLHVCEISSIDDKIDMFHYFTTLIKFALAAVL